MTATRLARRPSPAGRSYTTGTAAWRRPIRDSHATPRAIMSAIPVPYLVKRTRTAVSVAVESATHFPTAMIPAPDAAASFLVAFS